VSSAAITSNLRMSLTALRMPAPSARFAARLMRAAMIDAKPMRR
jgi:hypothetical protein